MSEEGVIQFDPSELADAAKEWEEKQKAKTDAPEVPVVKGAPEIPKYIERKVPATWTKMGSISGTVGNSGEVNTDGATEVRMVPNPAWLEQENERKIEEKVQSALAAIGVTQPMTDPEPELSTIPEREATTLPEIPVVHPEIGMPDVMEIQRALEGHYLVTGFTANGPVLTLNVARV